MAVADFNEVWKNIIRPSIKEVEDNYRPEWNYNGDKNLVRDAIRREYEAATKMFAENTGKTPDTHKLCACICSAIVKSRIFERCDPDSLDKGTKLYKYFLYPTEMLAITAAMRLIKMMMRTDSSFTGGDENMLRLIEDVLPYFPAPLTDKHAYLANLLYYMGTFPRHLGKGTPLFDTGAYAVIFYHLDKENRSRVAQLYNINSSKKSRRLA